MTLENGKVLLSDYDFRLIYLSQISQVARSKKGQIIENDKIIGVVTNTQGRLLEILAINDGKLLKNDQIIKSVWPNFSFSDGLQVLRTNISRLTESLNTIDPIFVGKLETVFGQGYRWNGLMLEDLHQYHPISVRNSQQLQLEGRL